MMISLFKIDIGRRTAKLLEVGTVFMVACLVILVFPLCLGCQKSRYTHNVNYSSLLGYSNFDVNAEEIGTSTHGTILVSQSKPNVLDIKIVASVVIAPGDWVGVRFIFPWGCYVRDILCTYVDSEEPDYSYWLNDLPGPLRGYGGEIRIGKYHPSEIINGGAGTTILDFDMPLGAESKISETKFLISVGSTMADDGYWIEGVAYEEITVQLEHK